MLITKPHYKVAIVSPVPFYYHIPLYRKLANAPEIDLIVYYCSDETLHGAEVKRMYRTKGKMVDNANLLRGYTYKFLRNYSLFPSFMRWPFGLMNFSVWKEIKYGKYDAVVLQSWVNLTWWLAFLACMRFNAPVFFMTDSNILLEPSRSIWKKKLKKILLEDFFFKKTSGFLTSGRANEEFYKAYGVPAEKMVRVPFSWGYEWFLAKAKQLKPQREKLRSSFGIKKNDFVLLFVGRLSKEKLPLTLLDAYSRVIWKNKKLFLVGDGPLRHQLEEHIRHRKIKEVYLMGFQPRNTVPNFYTIADVLVLPSKDETWGIVVNEAICFGLPVIASNRVGSSAEFIQNGYNGFLFPAGDVEQLTACIERLVNLPPEERLLFGDRSIGIITQWVKELDPVQQMLKILRLLKK